MKLNKIDGWLFAGLCLVGAFYYLVTGKIAYPAVVVIAVYVLLFLLARVITRGQRSQPQAATDPVFGQPVSDFDRVLLMLAKNRSMNFLEMLSELNEDIEEPELEHILSRMESKGFVSVHGSADTCEQIFTLKHKGFGAAAQVSDTGASEMPKAKEPFPGYHSFTVK